MSTRVLGKIFLNYKTEYFPALLKTDINIEDRIKIRELLRKPFNPYIFRHTSLTGKTKLINEVALRQDAGWAGRSQMHLKYVHYYGNEATNAILKARGILPNNQQDTGLLSRSKECPNCKTSNTPDAQFCLNCSLVMNFTAYQKTIEERERKDQQILELKGQVDGMQQDFKLYDEKVNGVLDKAKKRMDELDRV